jgi:hypothetical protein
MLKTIWKSGKPCLGNDSCWCSRLQRALLFVYEGKTGALGGGDGDLFFQGVIPKDTTQPIHEANMALRKIIYAGRNGSKGHFRFAVYSLIVVDKIVMYFKTGQTLFEKKEGEINHQGTKFGNFNLA